MIKPTSKRWHDANSNIPCQWYGLYMRIKSLHTHMVTSLGSCVKWPLKIVDSLHTITTTVTIIFIIIIIINIIIIYVMYATSVD